MRKHHSCLDCGFLCWFTQHASGEGPYKFEELVPYFREAFKAEKSKGVSEDPEEQTYSHFGCFRRQWTWQSVGDKTQSIQQRRSCVFFTKYETSYSPEEHKELQREERSNRNLFNATLLGTAVGAAGAIAAQLLYALFSGR